MWIAGAVTMASVLASGLGSDVLEPVGTVEPAGVVSGVVYGAGGLDPSVSYVHVQEVREPRIWLDRGVDPVLEAGDRVRVYYRTDADAYVAILQIDTDGTTRMLYPRSPTESHYARAGRDYRLLFPRSAYWNVDDRPGVGYFFIVTSPTPFDLSDFHYSYYDGGWDLSAVGSTVYSDPYVAMDDYVARLVPEWEYVDYGLDFLSYSVGAAHEYPRFLCYQCHGFRPYAAWNPYRYTCVDFRVVVYDDPYFYPSYRYRADRVVMVGPRNPTRPRFEFKERAAGEPGTVMRQGGRGDTPTVADRPRTNQGTDRARVTPPRVVTPPVTAGPRARPDRDGPPPTTADGRTPTGGDATPRVGAGGGRVTPPPVGDREPRRPTLQRRSDAPPQSPRPPPDAARPAPAQPRPSAQPDRPSTRRPANPRAEPSARPRSPRRSSPQPASPRPSTSRSPRPSGGSPSVRPAPRARPQAAPSGGGSAGARARRPARTPPR